ncbi:ATP-binding protein [Sphingomonas sp. CJ99]
MPITLASRLAVAVLLVLAGALGVAALGADINILVITIVSGIAAALIAHGMGDRPSRRAEIEAGRSAPDLPRVGDLIEAIAEPILLIADNRVMQANGAARALLGTHILGQDVRIAIRHPAAAERLLARNDPAGGAPIHLVGLGTRDQRWELRTRRLATGQRLVHLIDRTSSYATERVRVDFVANASHELRTPLASILGFIETLGDEAGDDPETRARFLKVMHTEAVRMQRLIDDLMSLSRIEAEKYREPDARVDLAELAAEVVQSIRSAQDPRADDIRLMIEPVPTVRGDQAQLSQVLYNIVGNAMKYGRPGTPVTAALRMSGAMVEVSVRDQGEGVAPEHLPRLTERFYRVDSGRSRAMGGTGLGLAIVKHIVERHRGRMDIASQVGIGTTVTILLPIEGDVINP